MSWSLSFDNNYVYTKPEDTTDIIRKHFNDVLEDVKIEINGDFIFFGIEGEPLLKWFVSGNIKEMPGDEVERPSYYDIENIPFYEIELSDRELMIGDRIDVGGSDIYAKDDEGYEDKITELAQKGFIVDKKRVDGEWKYLMLILEHYSTDTFTDLAICNMLEIKKWDDGRREFYS